METLVSIIIPTYNSEKYLPDSIKSALRQTYKNIEIIVIDDGSTDKTKEIVSSYIKLYRSRIFYIYQENAGPGIARNRGIAESQGDYIAFLDADDIWEKEKLSEQMHLFKKNKNCVFIHTDYKYFDEIKERGNTDFAILEKKKFRNDIFLRLIRSNFIRTSTVVIKKNVLLNMGCFDPVFFIAEDYDLWLRVARKYKNINYIDKPLTGVRCHNNHITKNASKTYEWVKKVIDKTIVNNPGKVSEITRQLPFRYAKLHFSIGYSCFCNCEFENARAEFFLSVKSHFSLRAVYFLVITFLPKALILKLKKLKNGELK